MDIKTKENKTHSSGFIPYSYYKNILPEYYAEVPLHWHKEFELNFILEGSGEIRCGDMALRAYKGDIFIIQPGILHAVHSVNMQKFIYDTIVFNAGMVSENPEERAYTEFLYPLVTGINKIKIPFSSKDNYYNEMKKCTETIFSCARRADGKSDVLLKSKLLELFWFIGIGGGIEENCGNFGDNRIKASISYIQKHFNEEISIDLLASLACLSKSCFMGIFKQAAGMGAIEYLNRFRIKKVCGKLLHGEAVAKTAYECGFSNISNFNRQFRRIMGCTPLEYKKSAASRNRQAADRWL